MKGKGCWMLMGSLDPSVVLGAWESHVHGEGLDGSTQPAKETHAGHVGLDKHEPTSLRGTATDVCDQGGDLVITFICNTEASATEEPGAEKLHAGVCAGGAG